MCSVGILKEDPIDTTAILTRDLIDTSPNSACSSAEGGSICLVSGDIVITTEAIIAIPNGEAPVGILDATGRGRQ